MNKMIIERAQEIIYNISEENAILFLKPNGDLDITSESNYELLSEECQNEIDDGIVEISEASEELASRIVSLYSENY